VDPGVVTESPAGRTPASIVLEAVPLIEHKPPEVTSCWLYAVPTEAGGRDVVTICSGVPVWADRNEAAAQRPATPKIPRAYLAVITHDRPRAYPM
jgi:hypothetical protein